MNRECICGHEHMDHQYHEREIRYCCHPEKDTNTGRLPSCGCMIFKEKNTMFEYISKEREKIKNE